MTFSFEPVQEYLDAFDIEDEELGRVLGARSTAEACLYTWRLRRDGLTEWQARHIAAALRTEPALLWPERSWTLAHPAQTESEVDPDERSIS